MQFVVPQFIEVESKIIGPISARQFIIILVSLGFMYVEYRLLPAVVFIPLILITGGLGGALSFGKVNGQAMHYFVLSFFQTMRRPRLKIWERTEYTERAPKQVKEKKAKTLAAVPKVEASQSRLAEMSLMVDTGGTYASDDVRLPQTTTSVFESPTAPRQEQKEQADSPTNINLGR